MVCLVERGGRCGPNGGKRYDERMGRTLQATFTHKPNLPAFSRHSFSTVLKRLPLARYHHLV